MALHADDDDRWEEAELIWETQPDAGAEIARAQPTQAGYCAFAVGDALRAHGSGSWSIQVVGVEDGDLFRFFSREADHRPYLTFE